jgi:hypothetical protein
MATNRPTQSAKNVLFHQPKSVINHPNPRDVQQDKGREKSARIGTRQPAPREQVPRPQPLNPNGTRSNPSNVHKTRTVHTTLHLNPLVKAELKRIAEQEGLSVSKVGSAFLERGLQQHVDMRYGALLEPIIRDEIQKQMRGMASRFAWLLVRVAFDTGQIKSLVTNLLGRQAGVTEEVLKTILTRTQQLAKGNITRKTPQIKELIDAVEKWLVADDEKKKP